MMATIGRAKAVASVGKLGISGFMAWLAWGFIHILYLAGYKNRFLFMTEWAFFYITGKRAARLVSSHEDSLNTKNEYDDVSE
jgi:NADH dehydrogenase